MSRNAAIRSPASRVCLPVRKEIAAAIRAAPVKYTQKIPPGIKDGTVFCIPVPFKKWLTPKKATTSAYRTVPILKIVVLFMWQLFYYNQFNQKSRQRKR